MNTMSVRALAAARPVIRVLTVLNIVYGVGILALFATGLFQPGWPEKPLGFDLTHMHWLAPVGLRAIAMIGIIGAVIVHTILQRLLAIVDSVRDGDPFILENARRLDSIAWRVVVLELLRIQVKVIGAVVWESHRFDGLSVTPWLAVLMLFVLSGVFAHGARMRADLEGTV